MRAISRVGVVGCGLMGSGIAEVCARAGVAVVVREVDDEAVTAGRARIEASLEKARGRGKLSGDEARAALARLRFTTDLGEMADRDLVVEAVPESEALKLEVFADLDKVAGPG
ncbi:MAG: 3-hydroxyacyl-CoA dehydrogenase NAD-binding domain-containing protein, partial [Acidimicrobiia bacterium]